MKRILPTLFCSFGLILSVQAQSFGRLSVPVFQNGEVLENALTGGLNSPQLSAVDLNNDGLQDLYVFDRVGYTNRCFINRGTANRPDYIWAPEYEERFPELRQWVLLRDFNKDNAVDIFAYSDTPGVDGVIVYRGYYEDDGIHFARINFPNRFNLLTYNFSATTQVYVTGIDYPTVDDVDCDGDLDILTFNAITPGRLEWYKNEAIERRLGLDTLVFRLQDRCWGGFFESGLTPAVELAPTPGDCVRNIQSDDPLVSIRHAGSTVLSLDIDQDEDRDLIIGDLSFSKLNRLINGGSCDQAWINEQDPEFPNYDTPVDLPYFPAAFYLDINNDGREDLLVAPNADREAENKNSLWWYENIGTEGMPDFTLRRKDLLINTMLDMGGRTHPVWVDYNADGLLDLVVGGEGLFVAAGVRQAGLYLFENTGTAMVPEFTLVDDDFLGLRSFTNSTYNFSPTFGDLDGDGDQDIVVGEELGQLFYAENLAGPGNPMTFGAWSYGYMGIDVGLNSTPFLQDLNEDGRLDLLIGEFDGNINFFANTGTRQQAAFNPNPQTAPNQFLLGQIDARTPGTDGYSAPVVVRVNGERRLVTGTDVGRLEVYQVNLLENPFPLIEEQWGNIKIGMGSHPALADLDSDGRYEVVSGTARGGLEIFQTDWEVDQSVPVREISALPPLRIYPNPVQDRLRIDLPEPFEQTRIRLYRPDGTRVYSAELNDQNIDIPMQLYPPGMYWLQVQAGDAIWYERVVHY